MNLPLQEQGLLVADDDVNDADDVNNEGHSVAHVKSHWNEDATDIRKENNPLNSVVAGRVSVIRREFSSPEECETVNLWTTMTTTSKNL